MSNWLFCRILADGEAAMQEIFHVHLHVFPRFKGDGFGLKFSPEYYTGRPERSELDRAAAQLGSLIERPPARVPDASR